MTCNGPSNSEPSLVPYAPTESTGPILRVVDLHKGFPGVTVLRGVNIEVSRSEVLAIIGPSGSGKSTLLRCISFLDYPDKGDIFLNGKLVGKRPSGRFFQRRRLEQRLTRYRAEVGMVFQHFNLFPHFTVLQNIIEAPIAVKGEQRATAVEKAEALLERVGLSDKTHAFPAQLSGGQQQRVAIVRALAMEPKIMLFDEPTSALDAELVGEVLDAIKQLAQDGMTMLIVSHEIGFTREVADRVIFMDSGTIIEEGRPDEVLSNPTSERARLFLRRLLT